MTPSENLSLTDQLSHTEQPHSSVPPQLEPIDRQEQLVSQTDSSSFYLLTNLYGPEVKKLRKQANEGTVDGWGAQQTTHRTTENNSIQNGIALLTQRYANAVKPSIDDIKDYIRLNKITLEQNDFAPADFVFLDNYFNQTKKTEKDKELLQLCWHALGDINALCQNCDLAELRGDEHCTKRKQLFLKGLIQRLRANALCGHGTNNAIYEAMQCLHPDTKRIMDLAAIQDLITLTVQETLLDYLRTKPELNEQLTIIKSWLENSAEGHSIFSGQEPNLEQIIINKVCDKFKAKGYENINEKALKSVRDQLYATPLFLRDFESFETEFPDAAYRTQEGINTLDEHIKFFAKKSLTKKYSIYSAVLPNALFDTIIEKLLIEKIDAHKSHMSRAVFELIVDKLKDNTWQLDSFLSKVIANKKEHADIRFAALFMQLSEMLAARRPPGEIINKMAQLGSAEEMMWLLCRLYHKTNSENVRKGFGSLIIFLYQHGVKAEDCVMQNVSAAALLITAKLEPKPDILNIVPSIIQTKLKLNHMGWEAFSYTLRLCGYIALPCIIIFGISGLLGALFLPLTPVIAILTYVFPVWIMGSGPFMFRHEILNYLINRGKEKSSPSMLNDHIQLTTEQQKLYKDFFVSSKNALAIILSPLFKIKNIFKTAFNPYSSKPYDARGSIRDIYQPLEGIKHIIKGLFKVVSAPLLLLNTQNSLSSVSVRAANGLTTILRGTIELITTPFTYLVKRPYRLIFTMFERKSREINMISLALDLQNEINTDSNKTEIPAVTQNQYIDINTPLLDKVNHSSKKINSQFLNQAAKLHKEYKEFKRKVCTEPTQFQKDEKIKWKEVKSVFFKQIANKQTVIQDNDKDVIIAYCNLFTRHR